MKIIWNDIVIVLAFILLLGSGIATKFIFIKVETLTAAAEFIESNPIMRQALNVGYLLSAIQVIAVAILGGIYYLLRKKYFTNQLVENRQIMDFFTIALFLIFMQYFANDISILLGAFL